MRRHARRSSTSPGRPVVWCARSVPMGTMPGRCPMRDSMERTSAGSRRPSHDPMSTRARRALAPVVPRRGRDARSGRGAWPGSRAQRRPVRAESGARVPMAVRRRAAGGHPDRDPRRCRRRRTRPGPRKAATFAYDARAPTRSATARARPAASTASPASRVRAPNGFTMWLREQGHVFDWGTLQVVPVVHQSTDRLLRRRDDRARRVRSRREPQPPRELRGRSRLRGRRRPDVLADQAQGRLRHARPGTLRHRHAPARVRRRSTRSPSIRPAWTSTPC